MLSDALIPPQTRLDLLNEYLKPVTAALLSAASFAWVLGLSIFARQTIGLTLMVYALLRLHRNTLQHDMSQ